MMVPAGTRSQPRAGAVACVLGAVATIYTFVVRKKTVAANERELQGSAKFVGFSSIALWAVIGVVSRMIGLS